MTTAADHSPEFSHSAEESNKASVLKRPPRRPTLVSPPRRPVPPKPSQDPSPLKTVSKPQASVVEPARKEDTSGNAPSEDQAVENRLARYQPISPPSEPMQYRAIGTVRGTYTPEEAQFNRGSLQTEDGVSMEAVLLGRITSLVKNHLDLSASHLWVVYPRTRGRGDEDDQGLHLQIVGVWEPENLGLPGESPKVNGASAEDKPAAAGVIENKSSAAEEVTASQSEAIAVTSESSSSDLVEPDVAPEETAATFAKDALAEDSPTEISPSEEEAVVAEGENSEQVESEEATQEEAVAAPDDSAPEAAESETAEPSESAIADSEAVGSNPKETAAETAVLESAAAALEATAPEATALEAAELEAAELEAANNPEAAKTETPEIDLSELPDVSDNYFSIRGEIIKYDEDHQSIAIKILQGAKQPAGSGKAFRLKLKGTLEGRTVGYFWDLEAKREGTCLILENASPIGLVPPSKNRRKKVARKGGPPRGGGRDRRGGGPVRQRPERPRPRPRRDDGESRPRREAGPSSSSD